MTDKEFQDSFTVGTAAKGGAIKVYYDVDNWKATQGKIARALLLYQAFCLNAPSIEELGKTGDVK